MVRTWARAAAIAALGLSFLAAGQAAAKVEGETVYLGAAVSLISSAGTARRS